MQGAGTARHERADARHGHAGGRRGGSGHWPWRFRARSHRQMQCRRRVLGWWYGGPAEPVPGGTSAPQRGLGAAARLNTNDQRPGIKATRAKGGAAETPGCHCGPPGARRRGTRSARAAGHRASCRHGTRGGKPDHHSILIDLSHRRCRPRGPRSCLPTDPRTTPTRCRAGREGPRGVGLHLSLIHISEPTRPY